MSRSETLKVVEIIVDGKTQRYTQTKPGVLELITQPERPAYVPRDAEWKPPKKGDRFQHTSETVIEAVVDFEGCRWVLPPVPERPEWVPSDAEWRFPKKGESYQHHRDTVLTAPIDHAPKGCRAWVLPKALARPAWVPEGSEWRRPKKGEKYQYRKNLILEAGDDHRLSDDCQWVLPTKPAVTSKPAPKTPERPPNVPSWAVWGFPKPGDLYLSIWETNVWYVALAIRALGTPRWYLPKPEKPEKPEVVVPSCVLQGIWDAVATNRDGLSLTLRNHIKKYDREWSVSLAQKLHTAIQTTAKIEESVANEGGVSR